MKLQLTSILFAAILLVGCSKPSEDATADTSKTPAATTGAAPSDKTAMSLDEYGPKVCSVLDEMDAETAKVNGQPDAAGAKQILDKEKAASDQLKALQPPAGCQPIQDAAIKYVDAGIATSTALIESQKSGKDIPADQMKTLQTNGLTAISDLATAVGTAGYDPNSMLAPPRKLAKAKS